MLTTWAELRREQRRVPAGFVPVRTAVERRPDPRREKARELRRAGFKFDYIAAVLGCAPGTASRWCTAINRRDAA